MSWHYLQGQEAASWEGSSLDGAPSALLRLIPTPAASCSQDKPMDALNRSPFGMTLRRSTGTDGAEALMWFRGDSPVRTYLPPAKEEDSMETEADCGPRWPGSLAKFNQGSFSWKTRQCSLFGGLTVFSGTWPRWGTMHDGEFWAHEVAVDQWNESGCGLPAPTKCMGKRGWGISNTGRARYSEELQENARRFGYKPHPSVLEWSMGWIPTWTRLVPLATDKFRQWLHSHGAPSRAGGGLK